ncbi:MAG: FAD/NAD(P)-binding protein [Phycisphaerales bacterium]|nr:FAD/NAD(P)-binding protein [Phycisphaerales bacterium]
MRTDRPLMCPPQVSATALCDYVPRPARVMSITKMTPHDALFSLELIDGKTLGHRPGQFVQFSILGVGECPISVCSSPTRPQQFQLSVRRVGEVTSAIHRLRTGEIVGVRGPLGRGIEPSEIDGRDILVAVGGCALAPARSLIHYILDQRVRFGRFDLLYGAKSPREMLFRNELKIWRDSRDLNCQITVDAGDATWRGRTGAVTRLFEDLPPMNTTNTVAVIIGPPAMFRHVLTEVLKRGIPADRVFCSLERRMKCGIGKCGHCQVNDLYSCIDGPVFRYSEIRSRPEAFA